MWEFNQLDPFPLWPPLQPEQYAAAKRHAAAADAWLGLRVEKVEASILGPEGGPEDGQERWLDRHPSIFLTPYVEFRAWLELLAPAPGAKIVDLGAGYGRLGFVMARHFPQTQFLGFEIVAERVKEGASALARFPAPNARLEVADLSSPTWSPPLAEIYFIYDYGSDASVSKTLEDLRKVGASQGITVVGRGRRVRDKIEREHPWLGSVHGPRHFAHYSIYRSFG